MNDNAAVCLLSMNKENNMGKKFFSRYEFYVSKLGTCVPKLGTYVPKLET